MKKLLTLFTLLLTVCSGAWGDETTFALNKATWGSTPATSKTQSTITLTIAKGSGSNDPGSRTNAVRLKPNNTLTVSSSNTITAVQFTYYTEDKSAPTTNTAITASTGSWSNNCVNWSGSATSITFTSTGEYDVASVKVTYTTGSVVTPTLPASSLFIDSKSVEISCATDGATIYYSYDNSSWTEYSTALNITETTTVYAKAAKDEKESSIASATYTKIAPVTGLTTWDWADVTNGTAVDFSDTEMQNVDVIFANISASGFTAVAGLADQDKLLMNGQRAYNNANDSKHCQVNYLKFYTTVAGTVSVEYANTGKNDARTVNVNGAKGTDSSTANSSYKSETFDVSAGEIKIKGVQVSDDADKMLRIRKVVFTPTEVSVTISDKKYASFASEFALDFSTTDVKAYTAKVDENEVKLTKVDNVPASEGVILYCETPGTYNIPVMTSAGEVGDNEMVGVLVRTLVEWTTGGKYNYILQQGQFNKANDGYLKANRAYLSTTYNVDAPGAKPLTIVFNDEEQGEETDGIKSVQGSGFTVNGEVYNLSGQRVGADYKGLVIINGKKVIRK